MNIYIYQADVYCEACAKAIMRELRGSNTEIVDTTDSEYFPQGPFRNTVGDSPHHCASGWECLNPLELGGHNYGAWLENDLTPYGVEYVKACIERGGVVAEFWEQMYSDQL